MLKELLIKYVRQYYKIILIIGGMVCLSSVGFIIIYQHARYQNDILKEKLSDASIVETIEEPVVMVKDNYYVDIKGAVINPNVYQVEEGTRIIDIIKLAGGLTDKANTSILNLSKKVNDEMVIIIYTNEEIENFKQGQKTIETVIEYIEKACVCPDPIINGACDEDKNNNEDANQTIKISLNNATKEELMALPGIGEAKAQDIITYRLANGFKIIDDLKNVKGIGDSIFDKIKDLITI